MTTQLEQDWKRFQVGIFWFGASVTIVMSALFFALALRGSSDMPAWYLFNIAAGPTIAYVVSWLGSGHWLVRVFAAALYFVAVVFTFFHSGSVLYLPGLIALLIGIPSRAPARKAATPDA